MRPAIALDPDRIEAVDDWPAARVASKPMHHIPEKGLLPVFIR